MEKVVLLGALCATLLAVALSDDDYDYQEQLVPRTDDDDDDDEDTSFEEDQPPKEQEQQTFFGDTRFFKQRKACMSYCESTYEDCAHLCRTNIRHCRKHCHYGVQKCKQMCHAQSRIKVDTHDDPNIDHNLFIDHEHEKIDHKHAEFYLNEPVRMKIGQPMKNTEL